MRIEVLFTNLSPYHSAQPGVSYVTLDGHFTADGSFPCIRTRRMPIPKRGAESEDSAMVRFVPIMPANSLRHELREAMLQGIFDIFRGKHSLSIGAYAASRAGNASGNPEGVPATFAEMREISQHPFLGLFGGGPRMIEGKLAVDSAYPITPDALTVIGSGYEEYLVSGKLTQVEFKRRVDPITAVPDEDVELIEQATQALTEWSDAAVTPAKNENEARGLRAFNAHEIVIPGVTWLWRIDVRTPTDAQVGLILNGLAALDQRRFGGMNSLAYGKVAVKSIQVDGEEVWTGQGLAETDSTLKWCDAWAMAADNISPADFENFVGQSKAHEAKQAKKAAKQ